MVPTRRVRSSEALLDAEMIKIAWFRAGWLRRAVKLAADLEPDPGRTASRRLCPQVLLSEATRRKAAVDLAASGRVLASAGQTQIRNESLKLEFSAQEETIDLDLRTIEDFAILHELPHRHGLPNCGGLGAEHREAGKHDRESEKGLE